MFLEQSPTLEDPSSHPTGLSIVVGEEQSYRLTFLLRIMEYKVVNKSQGGTTLIEVKSVRCGAAGSVGHTRLVNGRV